MKPDDKEILGNRFFRNELSEADTKHLKQLLKAGGPECDEFLDQLYANHQMVTVGQQLQGVSAAIAQPKRVIRIWPLAVAALLACGIYFFILSSLKQSIPDVRKPVLAKWVKLSEGQEVVAQVNRYVHPGYQKLPEGNYQLVFSNGTKVNLNQKAEFDLIDEENMVLHYGNLLADVSEETKAFRVKTPGAEVVDLGTVFGIQVDEEKKSNIYVKQGVVSVASLSSQSKQVLRLNEQVDVNAAGDLSKKYRYVEPLEEIIPEIESMPNRNGLKWLHWDFEKDFMAVNQEATRLNQKDLSLVDGDGQRLPKVCESPFGKGMRFDGKDDRLASSAGSFSSRLERSLSFWLRVPKRNPTNEDQMLMQFGDLEDGVNTWTVYLNRNPAEGLQNALKLVMDDGFLTLDHDMADGRWHHVALVFVEGDRSNVSTHVLFYIDGVVQKASAFQAQSSEDRIGSSEKTLHIGSLDGASSNQFDGDIDELWMFEQALLPEEIVRLRDRNSPFNP